MTRHISTATTGVDARLLTLCAMLETRRPMGTGTERAFIRRYIEPLPGAVQDRANNWHVIVPDRRTGTARVLWSCHTDTVHRTEGRQGLYIGPEEITLGRNRRKLSNCLGADDTVGVWICREMVLAGVPGHYVFHYGEERGGIGSGNIVAQSPELFRDIECAIALDRRGTTDVITYQACGRCCSDAFAESLAAQLQDVARYAPCDSGIYTDTAEYTGIVGECTNLSVGYRYEHSPSESLNYRHALRLLEALCVLDTDALVCERVPGDDDDDYYTRWDFQRTIRDTKEDDRRYREWLSTLSLDDYKFLKYLEDK